MTDLEIAKAHLEGHSICLCLNGELITDDGRGISPMIKLAEQGVDLKGYSAADLIVGKAAAMLFTRAGVRAVYGRVMSSAALDYLKQRGILCEYDTLASQIINRRGDGSCPMEATVADIEDPNVGYLRLRQRLQEITKGRALS